MPSESRQVRSAQQGDEAAFAALITGATPLLYNTAWRLLHNEADVADVLQEAAINAWQHLPTGERMTSVFTFALTSQDAHGPLQVVSGQQTITLK
ncbi:RNA polymerase sigma factor [Schleiferilactobacillus shenzhenensis]|uniref:RNA polymerase sigma-70 region 2 domain-containing protein n=1 Tax=Schleiferilactobacillus shenzhenensis LY-73 TaxID=1231336 RepID=U4TIS8_9LACO|nr:sigma factor [Schleiferilactobacillus shenzhenensis]ERL64104.1 hypothetical protein L248_1637 [Schleiferilactobacillus shenzhenensis LY-73]